MDRVVLEDVVEVLRTPNVRLDPGREEGLVCCQVYRQFCLLPSEQV